MLGILVAGAPIILFNAWLKKQGDDEMAIDRGVGVGVGRNAARADASRRFRILSARGVDSCKPAHVEAMRQTALLTGPIKQVMLIAANGDMLCTDTGGLAARQEVLTSAATANSGIVLDVIRLPDRGERFLRVRKAGQPDKPALAALVPASLLLPQASTQGGAVAGHCTHRDGRRNAGRRCPA